MTNKKPLKVINELAREIYGEDVFVDVLDKVEGNSYWADLTSIDIYKSTQEDYPMLSVMHAKAYDIMIELLRNIKKVNKDI